MVRETSQRTVQSAYWEGSRRSYLRAAAASGLIAGIAGCSSSETPSDTTPGSDGTTKSNDGENTDESAESTMDKALTLATNPNVVFQKGSWGLNPYNPTTEGGEVGAMMIDRFMQFNPKTSEFLPRIAKDFSVEGDVMRVTIDTSYGWANGESVTADDFVTKFKLEKHLGYGVGDLFEDISAKSESEVEIQLVDSGTNPKILGMEFLVTAANIPASLFSDYVQQFDDAADDEAKDAVQKELQAVTFSPWENSLEELKQLVSGPYQISEFNTKKVMMEPNENYPRSGNLNYNLEYIIVRDQNSIQSLLKSDKLDAEVWAMSNSFLNSLPAHHEPWVTPKFGGNAIMFMMDDELYGHREVRQAINYIIDQEMMTNASDFVATPVTIFTGMPDAVAKSYIPEETLNKFTTYEQDFAKAEELLKQVGFTKKDGKFYKPNGDVWKLQLPVDSNSQDRIKESTVAIQNLKDFGIQAELQVTEAATYWKRYRQQDWSIANWAFGSRWNPLPYFDYLHLYSGEDDGPEAPSWNHLNQIDVKAPFPVGDPDGELKSYDFRQKLSELQQARGEKETELITELAWVYNQNLFVIPISHETRQQVMTNDHWSYPSKEEYNESRFGVQYREMIREGKLTAKS